MSIYKSAEHLARRTDPASSHIAARQIVASGARNAQQQVTLDLVRKYPGSTSDELAEHGLLDRYQLARRLPELEKDRLVKRGDIRKSKVSGRPGVVWYVNHQSDVLGD